MSTEIQVVSARDPLWNILIQLAPHDIYHTREYHLISPLGLRDRPPTSWNTEDRKEQSGQESFLFSYRRSEMVFLFPYVLRTLEDILGREGRSYFDVTSVYGYGGPLASPNSSSEFLRAAWDELFATWRERGVISAFTRFHPLLRNVCFTQSLSEKPSLLGRQEVVALCGNTISIDLLKPEAEQFRQYQKKLRTQIRNAYSLGFEVTEEDFDSAAAQFVELYTQTMKRRNASAEYLIDCKWLERFVQSLQGHCCLLAAKLHGVTMAILLVMEYGGFLHAHLAGIDDRFTAHSPMKPLYDGTRRWAVARGDRIFHLGGGIGGRQDSLFQFKRHFSPDTNPFHIACWVLDQNLYSELSGDREAGSSTLDPPCHSERPFPLYRFAPHAATTVAGKRTL